MSAIKTRISDADLLEGILEIQALRELAYDRLGESNRRGPIGSDIDAFTAAMDDCKARMNALIRATGRTGVEWLYAEKSRYDGYWTVTAWYPRSRTTLRDIARVAPTEADAA